MFKVQAGYKSKIEVAANLETAREFFSNVRNYLELMPGVEAIETLADNSRRWTIRADVPMIGAMRQNFIVTLAEDSERLIEWTPAPNADGNLMRYAAKLTAIDDNRTEVFMELQTDVRRASAKDLHTFASWVGEARISKEMQRGVDAMMNEFMRRAKQALS